MFCVLEISSRSCFSMSFSFPINTCTTFSPRKRISFSLNFANFCEFKNLFQFRRFFQRNFQLVLHFFQLFIRLWNFPTHVSEKKKKKKKKISCSYFSVLQKIRDPFLESLSLHFLSPIAPFSSPLRVFCQIFPQQLVFGFFFFQRREKGIPRNLFEKILHLFFHLVMNFFGLKFRRNF